LGGGKKESWEAGTRETCIVRGLAALEGPKPREEVEDDRSYVGVEPGREEEGRDEGGEEKVGEE
jgi:hypothetical protein